ncbi:MAG TPA: GNAT family N-acetyltransferase [Ignavibacteria bacterium]|nr:GNAT family N-acetyltransferase [Ignavibacteria bacterium]
MTALIESERLILRELKEKDLSGFYKIRSNEQTSLYIDREIPKNENEALLILRNLIERCLKHKWYIWGIFKKNNNELIGTYCLWNFTNDRTKGEIGFEVLPEFQRMGFISEATDEVMKFCKEKLGVKILEGYADAENLSSINLLLKKGFRFHSQKKETTKYSGKDRIISIYQFENK